MKFPLKFLIPLLFFAVTLHSQTKIGLSANLNYGTFYSTASDWKGGFALGLFQERQWTESVKFRIEANYIKRGGILKERYFKHRNHNPGWMYISDFMVWITYIEIPLILKFDFFKGSFKNLEPFTGIGLSLPVSSDYSKGTNSMLNPIPLNPNQPGLIELDEDDGKNQLKPNLTLYFGFDYNFNKVQINIRYGIDLIPLEYIKKIRGVKEYMHYFSLGVSVSAYHSEYSANKSF